MINVAFLLLVFFLIAARLAPPDPLPVTLPEATGGDGLSVATALVVGADGALAFGEARGEAVFAALGAGGRGEAPLVLKVDQGFDAGELARLLSRLGGLGIGQVSLAVAPPR